MEELHNISYCVSFIMIKDIHIIELYSNFLDLVIKTVNKNFIMVVIDCCNFHEYTIVENVCSLSFSGV